MTTSLKLPSDQQLAAGLAEGVWRTVEKAVADGTPEASLRAYENDLRYLEAWHRLVFEAPLAIPASQAAIVTFYAHHMFVAADREADPAIGMPVGIEQALRDQGFLTGSFPPAYSSIKRRVASWSKCHALAGCAHELAAPRVREVKKALRNNIDTHAKRKSEKAITAFELRLMLDQCPDTLMGWRDRALLAVMYASGGRRRSEPGKLMVEDISFENVPEDPSDPEGPRILAARVRLPKTKRTPTGYEVAAVGEPAELLRRWLSLAGLTGGPLFPSFNVSKLGRSKGDSAEVWIDREAKRGIGGGGIAAMVKLRLRQAGLDPALYSAHGIRAGFMTDAQAHGIPLADAMLQSTHRSSEQAMRYYNAGAVMTSSARLMSRPATRRG